MEKIESIGVKVIGKIQESTIDPDCTCPSCYNGLVHIAGCYREQDEQSKETLKRFPVLSKRGSLPGAKGVMVH